MTLVLLFHLEPSLSEGPIITSGWIGVDLFFVLSGFLITGILLEGKGQPHQLKNFFARRVLRIFPLYYLALFLLFVVAPALTSDPTILYPRADQPFYVLYVQNLFLPLIDKTSPSSIYLSHTWSLAIEEQFYLVWPWLVIFLPRRVLVAFLCTILIAAPLARLKILSEQSTNWYQYWFVYKNTLLHVDGLAIGSLLALAVRWKRATERAVRFTCTATSILILPFTLWVLFTLANEVGVTHYPYTPTQPLMGSLMFSLLAVGFGGLLGAVLTLRSRPLDWVLCNPVSTWIGRISYGLYVYHFPVILAVRGHDLHPSIAIIATFSIAAVSWYGFERPILGLKSRFA